MCPIKVKSNTIELIIHTPCYCVLGLLCVSFDKLNNTHLLLQIEVNVVQGYLRFIGMWKIKFA